MTRRAVRAAVAGAVVVLEVLLYRQYASLGTEFHFWLHLLMGGWLGVGALAALELLRGQGPVSPLQAGSLGQAWSVVPDVLFLAAGVLHVLWMDVFALHVTAHLLWPDPLVTGSVLWVLSVLALLLVRLHRRRGAVAALLSGLALVVLAVALRTPLPSTLEEVRELQGADPALAAALADSPWLCRASPLAG